MRLLLHVVAGVLVGLGVGFIAGIIVSALLMLAMMFITWGPPPEGFEHIVLSAGRFVAVVGAGIGFLLSFVIHYDRA